MWHYIIFICFKYATGNLTIPYVLSIAAYKNHDMIINMNAYFWKICSTTNHTRPCTVLKSSSVEVSECYVA